MTGTDYYYKDSFWYRWWDTVLDTYADKLNSLWGKDIRPTWDNFFALCIEHGQDLDSERVHLANRSAKRFQP